MIRVVVADDHAVVREGLKRILAETGDIAVVGEAADAAEALDQVRALEPDVVVTDISMPGRGGLELLHELKRCHPKLPVLVLSIHPEDQLAVRVLRAGAAGYLNKDSASEQLVRAVVKAAQGGRYVSDSVAERLAMQLEKGDRAPHERLSDREFQVLELLGRGRTVSEAAAELALSVKTVSTYRGRLLGKLGLQTTADLVSYAVRNGIVS